MTARALAAIPFIVSFAVLIGLAFVNRRTLFGDPVEDITDYGADWPRVDPAFHEQLATHRERNEHV